MKVVRVGFMLALVLTTCGCAHIVEDEEPVSHVQSTPWSNSGPLQCVPYARDHSGIRIFGDAYTWWDQAAGRYMRSSLPREGAVMAFVHYAGIQRGHVAVVHQIISTRKIRIDHANWFDDGKIYVDDPVEDVSLGNDWSLVRVWNMHTGSWGKAYDVQGFIWPTPLNNRSSALF
jgi:surface antigen